ncbi:hypothetical protein SI65_02025 [Aspergillus cristatus]|uniref:Sm domain-containing protein n=1 Tax=Aspergillus cristatus TaxID=573508 RepID=A0A1E3BV85_ASPCR|nr:hypothetical protein SI65_01856 [Aspergillus cristatus]ODM24435.1 hypothetical protein SI65_02025 [Aspergillus cristatus]
MDTQQAVQYLDSLIGQTLRVHTTDTRLFVGTFKCTDAARNVILATTHEYRYPSPSAVKEVASGANDPEKRSSGTADSQNVKANMTSRLIGLVVIPGQHITRIELEETPEQVKVREVLQKS